MPYFTYGFINVKINETETETERICINTSLCLPSLFPCKLCSFSSGHEPC